MNQELLDAIKKRKQKLGVDEPQPEKMQPAKQNNAQGHGENFNQNKKMLEELFGGKKNAQEPVHAKKEEIKGDQAGFKNAKALLEQQFGNKGGNANSLNVHAGISGGNLPPPPPLSGNPLPPPPPLFDLPPLPIPSLDLPPLPPLPSVNLPPPPSFNGLNLPPPPSLNNVNLPPPPSFNPPQHNTKLPPPINLPPPPMNLPPPPVNNLPSVKLPPQNNILPPPPSIKLPPPPINNQPPPNYNKLPPPPIVNNLPPPPTNILPPPPTNILPPPPTNILPPPPMNILPPPPMNILPPPQNNYSQSQNQTFHNQPQPTVPPKNNIPPPKVQDDEPCFILSGGVKPSVPVVTGWDKDELQKSKKKRIFDKKSEKKYPITEEFFGKNLGALIKQQFLRTVNIIDVIDKQVKRATFQFHFPSIENKIRNIEPIETLYADTDTLDLVSCYMTKNLNAAKAHNEQRDQFVTQLRSYNWQADPLKWKVIRDSAAQIPNSKYVEPNFVQIKNAFKRLDNLLSNLAQQQDFAKCAELKGLKVETENMLKAYLSHPTSNPTLIQRIDQNVSRMKNMQG